MESIDKVSAPRVAAVDAFSMELWYICLATNRAKSFSVQYELCAASAATYSLAFSISFSAKDEEARMYERVLAWQRI
jgi:hypothetical protein